MIHLGDITKISGYDVPVVDCVIGGSPCQDLSIAGKREGLAGERSGLFMEQIRLIKEMKEADVQRNRDNGRTDFLVRPRYMVWENVEGAFSSNGGKDFKAVLEETIRIAESEAPDLPMPEKGWSKAGVIVGDGWSVAWRTHDAQYWGVPQRRKRISLVADFGGQSAAEILFECKSVSRNPQQGGEERERPSEGTEGGSACTVRIRGGIDGGGKGALVQTERSGALGTGNDQTLFTKCYGIGSYHSNAWKSDNPNSGVYEAETAKTLDALNCGYPACNQGGMAVVQIGADMYNHTLTGEVAATLNASSCSNAGASGPSVVCIENHPADSRVKISDKDLCQALTSRMGTGGGNVPMVMCLNDQGGSVMGVSEDVVGALRAQEHGHQPIISQGINGEVAGTLDASYYKGCGERQGIEREVVYCLQGNGIDRAETAGTLTKNNANGGQRMPDKENFNCVIRKTVGALCSVNYKGVSRQYVNQDKCVVNRQTVRRLTPLECERLQGFPDGWTDIGEWIDSKGKKHECSDSARYKALGNSIALPFWRFLCKRISAQYARKATMASLFDGIGGFPLVWEEWNGKGSAVWASEIEEFPIAVTKYHFGGE